MASHDEFGREIPDLTPVAIPANVARPESQESLIKRIIREELSMQASSQGFETFEESLDFDVDDDAEFVSQYEYPEMIPDYPIEREESNNERQSKRGARQYDPARAGDDHASGESIGGEQSPPGAAPDRQRASESPAGGEVTNGS